MENLTIKWLLQAVAEENSLTPEELQRRINHGDEHLKRKLCQKAAAVLKKELGALKEKGHHLNLL